MTTAPERGRLIIPADGREWAVSAKAGRFTLTDAKGTEVIVDVDRNERSCHCQPSRCEHLQSLQRLGLVSGDYR